MSVLDRIRRLFRYNEWANRETLASLVAAARPSERLTLVMAHIPGAEELWLNRLGRGKASGEVWPVLDLDACRRRCTEVGDEWAVFLADLAEGDLRRPVEYVNTKGEPWENRVEDILDHVINHSAYHRGQIAAGLRESGHKPAYTDFIHCVRRGLID